MTRLPTARVLTEADAREIAEQAAEEGVRRAFLTLGVDLSSPQAVIEFQRDLAFARGVRQSSDLIKRQGLITAVGIVTAAVLGAIYMAFKGA